MRPLDPNLVPGWRQRSERTRGRWPSRLGSATRAERRENTRFPLANTEIRNHTVAGRVVDLARGGMAIESNDALRPGRCYTFTLTIGEYVETLEARVLWCRLRATERQASGDVLPLYRAGLERVRPEPP